MIFTSFRPKSLAIFICLAISASAPIGIGQVLYPYNPDGNADNMISVVDLSDFLSSYGNDFQVEDEVTINGSPLSEVLEQGIFSGDTIYIKTGALKLTNIISWNGNYSGNNCGEVGFPDEHIVPEGKAWKVVYLPGVVVRINGASVNTGDYNEIWMAEGDIMTFAKANSGCCPTNCPYNYNIYYVVEEYSIP